MCIACAVENGHVYLSNQKEIRRIFMCYDIARKMFRPVKARYTIYAAQNVKVEYP